MKPALFAVFFTALTCMQPAAAQETSPAQAQTVLAEVGAWTVEYQDVLMGIGQPLQGIDTFVQILDDFTNGQTEADDAAAQLEAWRGQGLETLAASRAAAAAVRAPPSLSPLGVQGEALERALRIGRDNLLPTIQEMERVLNAGTELGLAALLDPAKGYEARERAMYAASMQLVRVDRLRVDAHAAALPRNHPNHALVTATGHYYDTLIAVPTLALQELDGGGDRRALIASLRQSARSMRDELRRANTETEAMVARARMALVGEYSHIARTLLEAAETYPGSIRAYQGLADGVEQAANALEQGRDVVEVWADQETSDVPHLAEIERLERLRAEQMANIHQAL
jgi:hypothetical protein